MADDRSNVTVLQVLPSLVTGGVERGTIEITQAIAEAGGDGPGRQCRRPDGRRRCERAGGRHITLPLPAGTRWRSGATRRGSRR